MFVGIEQHSEIIDSTLVNQVSTKVYIIIIIFIPIQRVYYIDYRRAVFLEYHDRRFIEVLIKFSILLLLLL